MRIFAVPVLLLVASSCATTKQTEEKQLRDASSVEEKITVLEQSVNELSERVQSFVEQTKELKCPLDMVEVEGDFCPNVEQTCLKVDKSIQNVNGYPKCDEFAPTKCLSKERIHMHFCIDRYEWPNQKGVNPTVMVTWNDMKRECGKLGKRICQDREWSQACEGPEMLPYPYGLIRDSNACNIDHPQKPNADITRMDKANVEYLWQGQPSGSMPRCVSAYGVYDMTGNVDESVTHSDGPYKSAEMGGHWVKGARNRCRPKTTVHGEDFAFYEIGGRCCKSL